MTEANRTSNEMTDEEAAEIGRAFMERLCREEPGYSWSDSPAEVLTYLINQRDDAKTEIERLTRERDELRERIIDEPKRCRP